jgi:HNH endonuclease
VSLFVLRVASQGRSPRCPNMTNLERWSDRVSPCPETGCWLWVGATDSHGYGSINGFGAHRKFYQEIVGPIPPGLELDHLCRVRCCVNPAHLEPVTKIVNNHRTGNRSKTHCPSGHAYDEANTRRWRNQRHCRTCESIQAKAIRKARKEAMPCR